MKSRWYQVRRTYRVYDDAYVFAKDAEHAEGLVWGSYAEDDKHDWRVTDSQRDLEGPLEKHSRARRVDEADVPEWIRKDRAEGWPEPSELAKMFMS